ncbi:MAG: hypothetical protein ACYCOU_00505 [Sulfobacillus sp.]
MNLPWYGMVDSIEDNNVRLDCVRADQLGLPVEQMDTLIIETDQLPLTRFVVEDAWLEVVPGSHLVEVYNFNGPIGNVNVDLRPIQTPGIEQRLRQMFSL